MNVIISNDDPSKRIYDSFIPPVGKFLKFLTEYGESDIDLISSYTRVQYDEVKKLVDVLENKGFILSRVEKEHQLFRLAPIVDG